VYISCVIDTNDNAREDRPNILGDDSLSRTILSLPTVSVLGRINSAEDADTLLKRPQEVARVCTCLRFQFRVCAEMVDNAKPRNLSFYDLISSSSFH
jgi:hypothetical protein